ncbi:MAG: hypothetical protein JOS17DRAFT_76336 [Linnemannia elongata]|nr:MAG: hypothetical protein JOS17DRAFT_76336 [Linnemannia elongata]
MFTTSWLLGEMVCSSGDALFLLLFLQSTSTSTSTHTPSSACAGFFFKLPQALACVSVLLDKFPPFISQPPLLAFLLFNCLSSSPLLLHTFVTLSLPLPHYNATTKMASVMLFPNVATHRRMPHLSKEPKETTTPKPTVDINQQQLRTTVLPPYSSAAPPSERTDSSSKDHTSKAIASFSSPSTPQQQKLQSSTTGKGHLTLSTTSTTSPYGNSNNDTKQVNSGASSSSSLLIEGAGGYISTIPSSSASTVSTPVADLLHHHNVQDHETSLHGHGHDREHPPQLHLSLLQHNQHQHQPLNAPHGKSITNHQHHPASSSSSPFPHAAPLPTSGTTPTLSSCPSNASATHESRLIKSALYDAFGCLYHPVQHTHTPCSPSGLCSGSTSQSGKLPMCATSSQAQVQQRSGEVTPSSLISPSPRAMSPMLRPHLGPSAPITPLELCPENGISNHGYGHGHGPGAAGYFGIVHGHGSGSGSSSASSRQLHQQQHLGPNHHHTHHNHHSIHGHGQQQHPLPPAPSLLSRTGSFNKPKPQHHHHHHHHHHQEDTLLHPHSHHRDSSTGSSSSMLSRKSSLGDIHLDPTEHPVLCSLQTLSLTHPHPASHYHQHLGHDLGHDRVSISDPDLSSGSGRGMTTMPLTPSEVLSKTNGPKA